MKTEHWDFFFSFNEVDEHIWQKVKKKNPFVATCRRQMFMGFLLIMYLVMPLFLSEKYFNGNVVYLKQHVAVYYIRPQEAAEASACF